MQNTKEFKAEVQAIMKATGATEIQAKSTAILNIILEQTKNAQGDFQRSIESNANQSKILTARIDDLQTSLGKGLLPITNAMTKQGIKLVTQLVKWADANGDVINSGIMEFVTELGVGLAFMVDVLQLVKAGWNFMAVGAKLALNGLLLPLQGVEEGLRFILKQLGQEIPGESFISKFRAELVESATDSATAMQDALNDFNNATTSNKVRKFFDEIRKDAERTAKAIGLASDSVLAFTPTIARRDRQKKLDKDKSKRREFITVDLRNVSLKGPGSGTGKTVEEKQLDEQKKTNKFLMALAKQGVAGAGTARAE